MKTKKILSLVLAVLMVASIMAACTPANQAPTTLVIATDKPAGIFNPLFAIEADGSLKPLGLTDFPSPVCIRFFNP